MVQTGLRPTILYGPGARPLEVTEQEQCDSDQVLSAITQGIMCYGSVLAGAGVELAEDEA